MSRVNMADKYIILAQYGQGFCHVSDSTNSRDTAFRICSHRTKNNNRIHTKNVVPTFYIMERIAFQKSEPKASAPRKIKASSIPVGVIKHGP